MGAEVTKVEPPQGGDYLQSLANGQRVYTALNGDKTVLRLDLKTEPGLSRVLEEAARSDVLIDSYRPGVLARLGLDYTHLNGMNPRLIYCSISGYGSQNNSRWATRGAYDHVIQAMTGMAMQSGCQGDAPVKVGFPLVDNGTALVAVNAILAALFERMRTGRGQYL
ncbi:MAG: CoA transferase, partial [Rhodocyclaceae bacterium]